MTMKDPFFYRLLQKAGLRKETRLNTGFGAMVVEEDRFEVGDFVFAKIKGHQHWPATVSQIETHYANGTSGHEKIKYNVYFYGSHQMCMLKVDSMVRFQEHYEVFKKKYAYNPKFTAALGELEADKGTREEYVKSLQGSIEDTSTYDASQEKPDDEMFSSTESSDSEDFISAIAHSPTSSSGFGDCLDSDEEFQTLRNQKYEILSMEKVPYLNSDNFILVISLGFKDEDLREDYKAIREEIRMMSCFVSLERLETTMPPRRRGRPSLSPKPIGLPSLSPKPIGRPPLSPKPRGRPPLPPKPRGRPPLPPKPRGRPPISPKPGGGLWKVHREMKWKPLDDEEPPDWAEEERRERNRRWKKTWNRTMTQPSATVLAAEAVKRRRRTKKKKDRDEARLHSLRHRTDIAQEEKSAESDKGTKTCCRNEKCSCDAEQVVKPPIITCPICQATFSSSVDYKQHSFNIHIMGL